MEGSSSPRYDGVVSSPRNGVTVAWPEPRGGTRADCPLVRRTRAMRASGDGSLAGETSPLLSEASAGKSIGARVARDDDGAKHSFNKRFGLYALGAIALCGVLALTQGTSPFEPRYRSPRSSRPYRARSAVPSPTRAVPGPERARPERVLPVMFRTRRRVIRAPTPRASRRDAHRTSPCLSPPQPPRGTLARVATARWASGTRRATRPRARRRRPPARPRRSATRIPCPTPRARRASSCTTRPSNAR